MPNWHSRFGALNSCRWFPHETALHSPDFVSWKRLFHFPILFGGLSHSISASWSWSEVTVEIRRSTFNGNLPSCPPILLVQPLVAVQWSTFEHGGELQAINIHQQKINKINQFHSDGSQLPTMAKTFSWFHTWKEQNSGKSQHRACALQIWTIKRSEKPGYGASKTAGKAPCATPTWMCISHSKRPKNYIEPIFGGVFNM